MKSKTSSEILAHLRATPEDNLAGIYAATSKSYYCNWEKHLGGILSRMVKRGLVERVKKGTFKLATRVPEPLKQVPSNILDSNQMELF